MPNSAFGIICRKKENAEELKRFWRNKHYAINSRHNKQRSHITHHLSQTMGYQKSKRPGGHPEAFAVIWANISISQRVCVTLHHQMYPKWEFHRLEHFSECEWTPLFEQFYRKAGLVMSGKPCGTRLPAFLCWDTVFPKHAKRKTKVFIAGRNLGLVWKIDIAQMIKKCKIGAWNDMNWQKNNGNA